MVSVALHEQIMNLYFLQLKYIYNLFMQWNREHISCLPKSCRLQYKSSSSFAFGCSHIPIFPTKMVGFICIYLIDLVLIVSPYFLFAFHLASDIEISNRRDQNGLQTFSRSFRGSLQKKSFLVEGHLSPNIYSLA